MLKVGITGGMGTGKSTVCKVFQTLGIATYDADQEAKALYTTHSELKQKVSERFGETLYVNGVFQKSVLAQIVFHDAEALQDLNALVHPIVLEASEAWFQNQKGAYAIKEAALLIESGGYKKMDQLILVKASLEERIERIKKRDQATEQQIMDRINKQMPEAEKASYANFVIQNGSQDALINQVLEIHNKMIALCD